MNAKALSIYLTGLAKEAEVQERTCPITTKSTYGTIAAIYRSMSDLVLGNTDEETRVALERIEESLKSGDSSVENIKYYVDMDGFIAKWDVVTSVEETFEPGYFTKREPEEEAIKFVRMLKESGRHVEILSAVYTDDHSGADKVTWLKQNGLGDIPYIFVPYGSNKDDYIDKDSFCVLIDDFSENLHKWQKAGHMGIKFYNTFNGHKGTWSGHSIHHRMKAKAMFNAVTGTVEKEFEAAKVSL